MYKFILSLSLSLVFLSVQAQLKPIERTNTPSQHLKPIKHLDQFQKRMKVNEMQHSPTNNLGKLSGDKVLEPISVLQYDRNKMPILIKGKLEDRQGDVSRQTKAYLDLIAPFFKVKNGEEEWEIINITHDELGMDHIRVQQVFDGVPIYNAELILHAKDGVIETVNGQGFPSPELSTYTPTITKDEVERKVRTHFTEHGKFKEIDEKHKKLLGLQQFETALNIYHEDANLALERLVYFVKVYEHMASYKSVFVDAHTGEIIKDFDLICKFGDGHAHLPPDGPRTASAKDLNNVTRTLNTFEAGSAFYLMDASRPMFSGSQSNLPEEGVGVIATLDALNDSPSADDFNYSDVKTSNNVWNDPIGVSAHYNAGIAYEYFKIVHSRASINGSGGNIISFINVTDEDDNHMDNAFWNGLAMWYGNGDQAFRPLAASLDVAGHEMTHGVVQASANLEYQGESGALNESFADIFAVMMDRGDYQIGEDVVFTNVFPSGALRDLGNPNNGGTKLGDNGYQPMHTSQQFFGNEDNGGVHINSGIPNHAFYQFAEAVGKEKAEQVYYRALTQYLTRSSQFVDARNAVVLAASDLYGSSEINAANSAFDQVGIGAGSGGTYQNDVEVNEGDDFVIYADPELTQLKIVNNNLEGVFDPLTNIAPISKPSVTDDGSIVLFVNTSNQIQAIFIDWTTKSIEEQIIQEQEIWSNVVISKNGNRLAAVEDAASNRIQIYDFNLQEWYQAPNDSELGFELYNPTFTEGVSTGDVQYADAMEFDITGEILMYDAFSEITGSTGQTIGYWDIGFINVFDNNSANWSEGYIAKLFSTLAEGISVGNPTYSKNSPYIVAFDYLEGNEFAIVGANIETGKVSQIFENSDVGYPSYTSDDNQMIFTNKGIAWIDVGVLTLNEDKISTVANSEGIIIQDGRLGVAFNNGTRPLTSLEDLEAFEDRLVVFPNPVSDNLQYEIEVAVGHSAVLQLRNLDGKLLMSEEVKLHTGLNQKRISMAELPSGNYVVRLSSESISKSAIISKL